MKWDMIRPDFRFLSQAEQMEIIMFTRARRRERYVPPPKKVKEKKPAGEKKPRAKKVDKQQTIEAILAELKRRQNESTQV